MKKFIKKTISLFMALCLFASMLPAVAAANITFTAVNDVFARGVSPSNMPTRVGGVMYVSYNIFRGTPGLKAVYNSKTDQLVLYNSSHILTFDMASGVAYDEQGTAYGSNAVKMNSTYYVPAKIVCDCFGFEYSYISKGVLGPIVRINSDQNTVSDDVLVERGFTAMRGIYNEFQASYGVEVTPPVSPETPTAPTKPDTNGTSQPPTTPAELPKKVVYLAFEGTMNGDTGTILDILSARNYTATFFASISSQPDYILRAAACGHTIGNNLGGNGPLAQQAELTSKKINSITKTKPRVLMIPGGSKAAGQQNVDSLIDSGYRIWDSSSNISEGSANAIYNAAVKQLSRANKSVVLCLDNSAASAAALSSLCTYFAAQNYEVRPITEINTPINEIMELR